MDNSTTLCGFDKLRFTVLGDIWHGCSELKSLGNLASILQESVVVTKQGYYISPKEPKRCATRFHPH